MEDTDPIEEAKEDRGYCPAQPRSPTRPPAVVSNTESVLPQNSLLFPLLQFHVCFIVILTKGWVIHILQLCSPACSYHSALLSCLLT